MQLKPSPVDALAKAREDFRAARFRAASDGLTAELAGTLSGPAAPLFAARVELRVGNPGNALNVLTQHSRTFRTNLAKGEAALLRGVAFARLGDGRSASAQFDEARTLLNPDDALSAELTYQVAAAAWMERRLDDARSALNDLPASTDADLDLQTQILRGAIASADENLPAQGAMLLGALRHMRPGGSTNVYLRAMLVTHAAALSVELPSIELRDAAIHYLADIEWTDDISDLHFHALRAIAWRHALDGDEFSAFRRLKEALAVTCSAAWRVAALADRAYLASVLGEQRWAAQELRDAHELASTIDWTVVAGEEKLALPILAELFAKRDPSVAINYTATFRTVGTNYPRVLSSHSDRRIEALEAYALGRVQYELGDLAEAKRLLERAWTIYSKLGIEWRAGRAALALAEIGDRNAWESKAQEALKAYPRSWLTRSPATTPAISPQPSPALERLTVAQRAVFDLLLDGYGTDRIAAKLGRSSFTVRNHIKAIFKAFGVTSRPALIVKATAG
jgi:DNA-binding NarL/FixJ family response regulator